MSELTGGCLCAALRYTLKAPVEKVVICHCTHCQKSSGSAFSVNVLASEADLALTGEVKVYEDKADSGNILRRSFCPRCGSSLSSQGPARPGMVILKAGSLDDPKALKGVAAQIWAQSKQAWVDFAFESPVFEQGFVK